MGWAARAGRGGGGWGGRDACAVPATQANTVLMRAGASYLQVVDSGHHLSCPCRPLTTASNSLPHPHTLLACEEGERHLVRPKLEGCYHAALELPLSPRHQLLAAARQRHRSGHAAAATARHNRHPAAPGGRATARTAAACCSANLVGLCWVPSKAAVLGWVGCLCAHEHAQVLVGKLVGNPFRQAWDLAASTRTATHCQPSSSPSSTFPCGCGRRW